MKKILIVYTFLLLAVLACQPNATIVPQTVEPTAQATVTQLPTMTPLPSMPQGNLLTRHWTKHIDAEGRKPLVDGTRISWLGGSGIALLSQSVKVYPNGRDYGCKLTTGVKAFRASSIVTSRLVFRVVGSDNVFLLNTRMLQPTDMLFTVIIKEHLTSVTVFIGIDKPDTFDSIDYLFDEVQLVCYALEKSQEIGENRYGR